MRLWHPTQGLPTGQPSHWRCPERISTVRVIYRATVAYGERAVCDPQLSLSGEAEEGSSTKNRCASSRDGRIATAGRFAKTRHSSESDSSHENT